MLAWPPETRLPRRCTDSSSATFSDCCGCASAVPRMAMISACPRARWRATRASRRLRITSTAAPPIEATAMPASKAMIRVCMADSSGLQLGHLVHDGPAADEATGRRGQQHRAGGRGVQQLGVLRADQVQHAEHDDGHGDEDALAHLRLRDQRAEAALQAQALADDEGDAAHDVREV